MDFESSVSGELSSTREFRGKGHTWEDVMYTVMGDASIGSIIVMAFAILFFAATPLAMLLILGAYSGGMRWLITLGIVAVMGFVAVYLMKKGVVRPRQKAQAKEPQTEFRGQLTTLTETVDRAASGYVYSQQVLRERLCDAMVEKIAVTRDLDPEELARRLEAGDVGFAEDPVLAAFLKENRRGAKGWDDGRERTKGKSAERGSMFMREIDDILKRMEAMV